MSSYFEKALSNFLSEFTTTGSIKHLVDRGMTLDQIIENMDYPASREKVSRQMYEYMLEAKILVEDLDMSKYNIVEYKSRNELSRIVSKYGKERLYFMCPFGYLVKNNKEELLRLTSCLTKREADYILGIPWILNKTYHCADLRMLEIASELMDKRDLKLELYLNRELF
ncbi:MAG: hypothetical protein K6F41_07025 [Lachnospira sp.]|nr:hypothetical protein [Lachnospira sp.]